LDDARWPKQLGREQGRGRGGEQQETVRRLRAGLSLCLIALASLLLAVSNVRSAEASLSEYQVKALFLVNFAKYVDWPVTAFGDASAPIVIGIAGESSIGAHLEKAIEGKTVNGRPIRALKVERDEDFAKCQILFVSAAEKKHLGEILNKVKELPVLTVGETEQFIGQGGVINFTKKESKVRLQIDLDAAHRAKLQLSSKLLSVADSVTGKP
jgi:hypothetical protein